ncbi:MAG: dTMP kinase [Candidatus Nanoarchaeia archaeon]
MRGKLIVFEGIDGSGKDTCQNYVAKYLKKEKVPFIKTEEPNSKYGIRSIIKDKLLQKQLTKDPLVDMFAFSLDRQLHVAGEILPSLKKGITVLTNRYYHSTIAYQGYLQGINLDYVMAVQKIFPKPDLTLIFDLPAELAIKRAAKRSTIKDKFETLESQRKLRAAYLDIAQVLKENIIVIDATKSEKTVAQQAIKAIKLILKS